jgi:hypothetical protein
MTTHMAKPGIDEDWFAAGALGFADRLRLAAAPTYAFMAVFTGIFGDSPKDMICIMPHASPLSGMVCMYTLMSVVHLVPWLTLIARWARLCADPDPAESRHTCHSELARPCHYSAQLSLALARNQDLE